MISIHSLFVLSLGFFIGSQAVYGGRSLKPPFAEASTSSQGARSPEEPLFHNAKKGKRSEFEAEDLLDKELLNLRRDYQGLQESDRKEEAKKDLHE